MDNRVCEKASRHDWRARRTSARNVGLMPCFRNRRYMAALVAAAHAVSDSRLSCLVLLYEFIKALKPRHYALQRQFALMLTGCAGDVSPYRPVCLISGRCPIDHRNADRSLAILPRLQFLQYETFDLNSAFRKSLHHASARACAVITLQNRYG